jgi:hypothetical protein
MGLVKTDKKGQVRVFDQFLEAKTIFENPNNPEELRLEALDYIIRHKEIYYLLQTINKLFSKTNDPKNNVYIDYFFNHLEHFPKRENDLKELLKMLKSDNAYLRNATITFLQEYGEEAKQFIQTLMNDKDRDMRIFAINILGDVSFEDSLDMLREFIKKESDINALMTAIDYLGEIGEEKDIQLLQEIKKKFNDDYLNFGIDLAIDRIKA